MKNHEFLGIDQTGAVNSKKNPRPLPACLIQGRKIHFFYLSTFSKQEIVKKINLADANKLLICIDCVLGLPESLNMTWREAINLIKKSNGYGMFPAMTFFKKIGQGKVPKRKIESLCNANSVFNEKPYQKNIQTGTYRLWKDISINENDFYAPLLENRNSENQIPIFEGYPSLSWKLLFGVNSRAPENLTQLITNKKSDLIWTKVHQEIVNKDSNLADAFVLALTMKIFLKQMPTTSLPPEGWILGFK